MDDAALTDRARTLEDIRTGEEQIARGEGVKHEATSAQVLSRLPTRESKG